MPFVAPPQNLKTGNSEDMYVSKVGDSTIDGNITIGGDLTLNGLIPANGNIVASGSIVANNGMSTATLAGLDGPVRVPSGIKNEIVNPDGTRTPIPVFIPSGISITPDLYTVTIVQPPTVPLPGVPVTFTPPLPAPNADNAGLYLCTGIWDQNPGPPGQPIPELIENFTGFFVNNGVTWRGTAGIPTYLGVVSGPEVSGVLASQPLPSTSPNGLPLAFNANANPLGVTITIQLYRIAKIAGLV